MACSESGTASYTSSQPEHHHYPSAASVARATIPSQYGGGASSSDYGAMMEQQQQSTSQQQQPPQPSAAEQEALQEGLRSFEQQLSATFEAILAGRVTDASDKILPLSRWLANSVVGLGLHHDDEAKYAERLALWQRFNLCWEALGQKQRDIFDEAVRSGRQPGDMLSADVMTRLVEELVGLCDQLEGYGLVDYELGIAEEQIVGVFIGCLDLLQAHQQQGLSKDGGAAGAGSASANTSRAG